MTAIAYRVVKNKHSAAAFDGDGARRYGGRWNSPGVAMVYASATLPLAVLEILVHLQTESVLPAYVAFRVEIPDGLVEAIDRSTLPAGWRDFPAPAELRAAGDAWVRGAGSVVLRVPSVVLASEENYLINPLHPDFGLLAIADPEPLDVDSRLFRR